MEIKISYADALRIVEARDKAYADDIKALVLLLRKRRLNEYTSSYGQSAYENDRIADLYEEQAISCAKRYVLQAAMDSITHASSSADQQK